ncbi:hypothetical protein [Mucilaginibacter auburnensis]|uniref:hypothetical protein n=1 Tax=Mucilaginibacter auburnensis TaxID=1457233 RepID=UPI0012FE47C7|nr:hypothetical protein [Mucilaginibacter auburnensis]
MIAFTGKAMAQCGTSIQNGDERISTSLENYQYSNTSAGYYSLLVQTILAKNNTGEAYSLKLVYTGNIAHANLGTIAFKTNTSAVLVKQLKLEKAVKNDESTVRSKVYTVSLTAADVEQIKNNSIALIELRYINQLKPINIKTNDADFLKSQINCVANL